MWPYWLMYSIPALIALSLGRQRRISPLLPWLLLGLFFTLCIGLRDQVGADWWNYLAMYQKEKWKTLSDSFLYGDPGYVLLNRLMAMLGWGVYGVNFICGAIFTIGLVAFCRPLRRPWLAFAVAVPYLIVVVAMGYSRQGVALGLIFWALAFLEQGKFLPYIGFIAVAALFHQTAIIMIPLGIFLYRSGWVYRILSVIIVFWALWDALVADDIRNLVDAYITQQMYSQGAYIRVAMNSVAAVFLLIYWKEWKQTYPNALLWLWMALASLVCLLTVNFATTATDRVALYLIPLQIVVFSRLPYLARKTIRPHATVQGVLLGYGLVLFVWLNFATHAQYWIPYRNVLFL